MCHSGTDKKRRSIAAAQPKGASIFLHPFRFGSNQRESGSFIAGSANKGTKRC
jgi:hypothetical protein